MVPYWLAGNHNPGIQPTRHGATGTGPGPAPDISVTEGPLTFIHCRSVRSHAASASRRARTVHTHAPSPSVPRTSPVLASLGRCRMRTESHGGCEFQRNRHRAQGAPIRVSLSCSLYDSGVACWEGCYVSNVGSSVVDVCGALLATMPIRCLCALRNLGRDCVHELCTPTMPPRVPSKICVSYVQGAVGV